MRSLYALLLAASGLACVTAFVAGPPKPKAPALVASMSVAGDSIKVRWTIAATPSDSLTVDVSATGRVGKHRMYVVDTKTDSLNFVKPAPGASVTVSLLATNWRGARSAAAPLASGTYVEPDTTVTPPSVQLQITPTSGSVQTGGQVQFQVKQI